MIENLFVFEENNEYLESTGINGALEDLLISYEEVNKSTSLAEDIVFLSKICKNYSKKKLVRIYQLLIADGYYKDRQVIILYGMDQLKDFLKHLIHETLEKSSLERELLFSDQSFGQLIDKVINENIEFEESFEKIFESSQGEEIYYRRYNKEMLQLFKYLPDNELLRIYEKYIYNQGLSPMTIDNYMVDIRVLLKWLKDKNIFYHQISRKIAKEYLAYILDGHQVNSYNKIVCSLSHFNKFLLKLKGHDHLVFIHGKDQIKDITKKSVDTFTEEEQEIIKHLLEKNVLSPRTDLIVALLFYTGIRVGELTSIELKNIDYEKKELTVIGKGKKRRSIPLKPLVLKKIKTYIKNTRQKSKYSSGSKYLIVSQRQGFLTREAATRSLKVLNEYIDARVYAHKFRHNFATILVNKDVRVNLVAEILGHNSIQTTIDYYVNTSKKDRRKAIDLL